MIRWNEWASPELCAALEARDTTIYRIHTGNEGWVERLDKHYLISYTDPGTVEGTVEAFHSWRRQTGHEAQTLYGRLVARNPEERTPLRLLWGETPPDGAFTVREEGLNYEVGLTAGFAYGLYPDQRQNRRFLRNAAPRSVLNLFAYTCAFSVAAAAAGATTLSVDLTRGALERGRRNFALNHLDTTGHRFLTEDTFKILPRLRRQGAVFDAVILDPPTFSRGTGGRVFRVEKDLPELIRLCLAVIDPSRTGWLLISTNCTRLNPGSLETFAREAAARTGKSIRFQPADHPEDLPPQAGPSCIWVEIAAQ